MLCLLPAYNHNWLAQSSPSLSLSVLTLPRTLNLALHVPLSHSFSPYPLLSISHSFSSKPSLLTISHSFSPKPSLLTVSHSLSLNPSLLSTSHSFSISPSLPYHLHSLSPNSSLFCRSSLTISRSVSPCPLSLSPFFTPCPYLILSVFLTLSHTHTSSSTEYRLHYLHWNLLWTFSKEKGNIIELKGKRKQRFSYFFAKIIFLFLIFFLSSYFDV